MSDGAVTVFASFRPRTGKEDELRDLLAWMVGNTRGESGCERYDLYREADSGSTFHLFERYRDDQALAEHRAAGYYVEYRERVGPLLEEPIAVVVLRALDAAD